MMRLAPGLLLIGLLSGTAANAAETFPVSIKVNAAEVKGELKPVFFQWQDVEREAVRRYRPGVRP